MDGKIFTVYELRGLGDDVNFLETETDKMCDEIKSHLSENVLPAGTIIEIVSKRMDIRDFKRFAE